MLNDAIERFSERWRGDPEFRARAEADPKAALAAIGFEIPVGEAVIAADTKDTVHIVFPPDPNAELTDDELAAAAGGSSGGTWHRGAYYPEFASTNG